MIEEIKIMLGDGAAHFTDAQIGLVLKWSISEVEAYCGRSIDAELEICAEKIAVIKLNRLGTEGLSAESFSGISQTYINGYPDDVLKVLNRKRLIKVV